MPVVENAGENRRESSLGSVFIFQKRGIGLDNYKSKESLSRVVKTL